MNLFDPYKKNSWVRRCLEEVTLTNEIKHQSCSRILEMSEEAFDAMKLKLSLVDGMDEERRHNLLYFWTAKMYLPMGCFEKLPERT
ncbi:hypothetical protein YC2023_031395 [Brassica napus]